MSTTIATLEDLQSFKEEIIQEIQKMKTSSATANSKKRWIRNTELQELLGISSSSIQNLRNNGTLPFTKLSGTIYYDVEQIDKLLSKGLKDNQ